MKILQIFGYVAAIHLLAFVFIFASPGCASGSRSTPTPDATMSAGVEPAAPAADLSAAAGSTTYAPPPTLGRAAPTRPGSPAAAAVVPPKPAPVEVAPVSTYTVARGDSLWSIAKKHSLTVVELAKANNVGTNATLSPGKKLIIPGKPGVAPTPKDLSTTAPAADAKPVAAATKPAGETVRHTVQAGESLGVIGRRYGVSAGEIGAANAINDPGKIRAGQVLIIPGAKVAVTKAAASRPAATEPAPAASTAAGTPAPAAEATAPRFEIAPPPPGQDLDSGLKETTTTDVPTVKIEEVKPDEPKS